MSHSDLVLCLHTGPGTGLCWVLDQARALEDAAKTPQPLCFSSAQVEMSTAGQAPVLDTPSEEDPLQLYTLSLGIMNAVAADGADIDHYKARCHAQARGPGPELN